MVAATRKRPADQAPDAEEKVTVDVTVAQFKEWSNARIDRMIAHLDAMEAKYVHRQV